MNDGNIERRAVELAGELRDMAGHVLKLNQYFGAQAAGDLLHISNQLLRISPVVGVVDRTAGDPSQTRAAEQILREYHDGLTWSWRRE